MPDIQYLACRGPLPLPALSQPQVMKSKASPRLSQCLILSTGQLPGLGAEVGPPGIPLPPRTHGLSLLALWALEMSTECLAGTGQLSHQLLRAVSHGLESVERA